MELEALKYPIGKYEPEEIKIEMIKEWIEEIHLFPVQLEKVVQGIDQESLMYTYRPDGWNIQQLVHHLADSHMNSIIRFKLALTEDNPIIKPYLESEWAKQYDVSDVPIDASLLIIQGVHARLSSLLSDMGTIEFAKKYTHPEHGQTFNLGYTIGMYAWHGNHHLAHIKNALQLRRSYWS